VVGRIEKTHHQLLLGGSFEDLLLSSPPELPDANVAGTKLEIVLFLGLDLLIHATSAASEHCRGENQRALILVGREAWRLSTRGGCPGCGRKGTAAW